MSMSIFAPYFSPGGAPHPFTPSGYAYAFFLRFCDTVSQYFPDLYLHERRDGQVESAVGLRGC